MRACPSASSAVNIIVRSQHYYGEAPRTLGLLRPRRERPRDRRAADERDELAPSD